MKFRTVWTPCGFSCESARYLEDDRWDLTCLHIYIYIFLLRISSCAKLYCKEEQPAGIAILQGIQLYLFVVRNQVTRIVQYYFIFFTVVDKQPTRKYVQLQIFFLFRFQHAFLLPITTLHASSFPLQVNRKFPNMRINQTLSSAVFRSILKAS